GPCFDSPWMTHATLMWYQPPPHTHPPMALEVSFTPTTAARLAARNNLAWDGIWEDLRDCVPIPAFPESYGDVHASLYKQLACHAVFGIHEELGGPTWDLESHRPNIPWEDVLDPSANEKCNWRGGGSSS